MRRGKDTKAEISIKFRNYLNYIVIFLCFSLMFSFIQSLQRVRSAKLRVSNLQNRVAELESRKYQLEAQVNETKSEKYVEEQLRTKLGLAKENEIVIVLPEDDVIRKFAPKTEIYKEELPDPNWKKWLNLFL